MNDESQKDKLRQHFARRVTTQARVVLDTWQKIHENPAQAAIFRGDFSRAADKLVRYAQRFEMAGHRDAGRQVFDLTSDWPEGESLPAHLAAPLEEAIEQLSRSTLRRTAPFGTSSPSRGSRSSRPMSRSATCTPASRNSPRA